MSAPLLEVIALDAADARHARDGGADRVELVSDMAADGLSPSPATVAAVRAAVDLPVRVMVRTGPGFAAGDLGRLRRTARQLRAAGAEEFVLGFLDRRGAVDLPAVLEVLGVLDGAPWTFHRAIDHAADRAALRAAVAGLPGLDAVLTSGAPAGLAEGLPTILAEAEAETLTGGVRLLAGGGLLDEHIGPLLAAGVTAFHSGAAMRPGRSWTAPVAPDLVRRLRTRLSAVAVGDQAAG
ncbi:copper homeostasis protein CutC [Dactylosporangium aurantiacum]|uniref:Copper homeostasis protein cutC homolog n=1 Tax=Dactylosporangium aurantiacum TaxID=35754 RepID=A0A9Q9MDV7_9ACTN|nr:copper homeostasis protein CutC [Dactylosporangium aurantiacum]MDG6101653.1 copper homeostasis protein CutC [Dactylosporangium aurantiacum]UWZ52524.1 copper homeostasis protein CutC [Dactylosporangium aurantiacum]